MKSRVVDRVLVVLVLAFVSAMPLTAGGSSESGSAGSGAADGQTIDYLGVAAVMIRDGNFERAARALEEVDPAAENVDLQRYYTLSGLVALRQGENAAAIGFFERAIDEGQTDNVINVYLAQAYYAEGRYEDAIAAIDRVPNLTQFSALYGVLAESQWQLGRRDEAYDTLDRAIEFFPTQVQFLRQQIFYLIDLDLTRAAAEKSLTYLDRLENDPAAYVTVGEALRRGGNPEPAIQTLEMGLLQHPADEQIHLALAQAYLDTGRLRVAGAIIERAAARNPALYFEAAEIFRRAGEFDRALFLNSLVIDEARKTSQRFSILLSMERYEESTALEARLQRTGGLEDDGSRYAMAFAFYQTRQFQRSIGYLNQIAGAEFFRQATQLRRAIETVRAAESGQTTG